MCSSPAPAPPPSSPTPSPAGPGSPLPLPLPTLPLPRLGQWPRRLDTPSPPAASRFLCQTKRGRQRGRTGAAGAHPQPREAWPAGEEREPSGPGPGSLDAAVVLSPGRGREETGLPSQPSPGRADGEGVGRSSRPHTACHTLTGHTFLGHTCGDADVYVRAHTHRVHPHMCTPSSHKTQTFTAHTCSYDHACSHIPCTTSPRPHTHCTHSDAYRQRQGHAYTQLTRAGIRAHPTHTQTHPCTYKSHRHNGYIPRYVVHIHGHTTSFSLQTSLHPCRPCRHTHGPQGPPLSKAHGSCHVAPSVSSQTALGSCLGDSVLAACALRKGQKPCLMHLHVQFISVSLLFLNSVSVFLDLLSVSASF